MKYDCSDEFDLDDIYRKLTSCGNGKSNARNGATAFRQGDIDLIRQIVAALTINCSAPNNRK